MPGHHRRGDFHRPGRAPVRIFPCLVAAGMNSRTVKTARRERVRIDLPPSKSYTARALIAASLACGDSTIRNASRALDTKLLIDALRQFGVGISARAGGAWREAGGRGIPSPTGGPGDNSSEPTGFSILATPGRLSGSWPHSHR